VKILEVDGVQKGIDSTLKEIKTVQAQMKSIQTAIAELISLDDALKGHTANAIFSFYKRYHELIIKATAEFLGKYEKSLKTMQEAVHAFEPHQTGYIREDFVSYDVPRELRKVQDDTEDLVTEANEIMSSVSDIIALDRLKSDQFFEAIQQGTKKSKDVGEELNALDASLAKQMNEIKKEADLISEYLQGMKQAFPTPSYEIVSFTSPIKVEKIPGYDKLYGQVYKEEIEANRLKQKMQEEAEKEEEKGFWDKVSDVGHTTADIGVGTAKGLWKGGKEFVGGAVNTILYPEETIEAIGYVALNSKEVAKATKQEITKAYERDMVNGNATKRSEFVSYTIVTVASSFLGDKGILKARKANTLKEGAEAAAKNRGKGKGIDKSRPSWRQSEIDVEKDFPDYNAQKSFKDGKEVPYGEKGSSRPDLYQTGHSIEVKNYKITTSSGRSRLVNNVSKQVEKRLSDLPNGTKQSVIIDIRGQNVSDEILDELYGKIMNKTNGKVDIRFKTN